MDKEYLKSCTREDFLPLWLEFKKDLNMGKVRTAVCEKGEWRVNTWVKEMILLGFKYDEITEIKPGIIDKDTMGERAITLEERVRTVGVAAEIRDGVYIGKGVTFMPPSYTNIGAYIDDGSMIDSLVLVGSCAQIGKNVHIGAGTIIGGVLEPVNAYPVIIEDNAFIGASCTITEGTIIKKNAIIGAGVTITQNTPVYDLVRNEIITPNKSGQIVIPEDAIMAMGARKKKNDLGVDLSINTPLIVKYGGNVELEDNLR